jgi:hypothetical protein
MSNNQAWPVQLQRSGGWRLILRPHLHTPLLAVLLTLCALPAMALGRNKQPIQHAPLPAKVMQATTIYIQNQTNDPGIADKAYTQLKNWGRYQIVDSKEHADVLLVFALTESHRQRSGSGFVSLYNSKSNAYTYGSIPDGPSITTRISTLMQVVDPKTSDVLWADQQPWRHKHTGTQKLLLALRQRIEEQSLRDETPATAN